MEVRTKMGAGASAANTTAGTRSSEKLENCWEVVELRGPGDESALEISSPLLLTITQESLDLQSVDKACKKVLHYPYHQIKCWSSTPHFFSFQLGVEEVQNTFKFKTSEGAFIQKKLLDTILKFMDQSKDWALQPSAFNNFKNMLFEKPGVLVSEWDIIADTFFASRPFRLTAAHALELLNTLDVCDEFLSLDFSSMLHKYILNQDSFKMVLNSMTDKELKLNLASRLGLSTDSDGLTVKAPTSSPKGDS